MMFRTYQTNEPVSKQQCLLFHSK